VVVFGQGGLEIGGGDMVWTSLVSTPLDEEAIAQAQHQLTRRNSLWQRRKCSRTTSIGRLCYK
jgi:hypothetical protein